MINITDTLYESSKNRLNDLMFLARDDKKVFKNLLALEAMDYLCKWAAAKQCDAAEYAKLREIQSLFVLKVGCFDIIRTKSDDQYRNVNTPQSSTTWKSFNDMITITPSLLTTIDHPFPPINN